MSESPSDRLTRLVAEALALADQMNLHQVGISLHEAQLEVTRHRENSVNDSATRLWSLPDQSDTEH